MEEEWNHVLHLHHVQATRMWSCSQHSEWCTSHLLLLLINNISLFQNIKNMTDLLDPRIQTPQWLCLACNILHDTPSHCHWSSWRDWPAHSAWDVAESCIPRGRWEHCRMSGWTPLPSRYSDSGGSSWWWWTQALRRGACPVIEDNSIGLSNWRTTEAGWTCW